MYIQSVFGRCNNNNINVMIEYFRKMNFLKNYLEHLKYDRMNEKFAAADNKSSEIAVFQKKYGRKIGSRRDLCRV